MMNKQQLIKNLGYVRYSDTDDERYNYYNKGIDTAISFAKKLAEPEKPVVPQFVADWLEVCKENLALSLASSMNNIVMRTNNQPDKTIHWLAKNSETFAKAWLYGYEIEKDKLFTAKLKSTNEYLHYDKDYKEIHHFKAPDDVANQTEAYRFTEDDLIKYYVWENEAYDVKEVKEND
ncbi:DUF1642 domain-containing protein [Streptococcus gallolyticus subsp. gallolyticus]|uniref:DUF1642 domain-containing protein n=1 Tax=Streptococcus gallolyticus TaxID=315405 RepID=UPI002284C836|nr:DUF1642 domain-containing protein [Streptococcus gallolyticus]MCY7157499.1 DUF1642 domain-containing protein [Streptococcus gallolyticus subsp. gallolyticus]